jgi:hypothetical protein
MLFSGAWGKMIHEKNLKQKSCETVPLKGQFQQIPEIRNPVAGFIRAKIWQFLPTLLKSISQGCLLINKIY